MPGCAGRRVPGAYRCLLSPCWRRITFARGGDLGGWTEDDLRGRAAYRFGEVGRAAGAAIVRPGRGRDPGARGAAGLSKALHLAGKRILITRARHQAGRLAEALEAHGAEVLRLPTIEIVPPETYADLDALLEIASDFDWLIVTSANGAAALADRMQFLGIPLERLKHLQVAAIGPATAAAVTRMGLKVSAMPAEYVAEAVVAMLREKVVGQRVLLARAAVARDVIPEQLRKCGADIHVVEAYRTIIPAASIAQVGE